MNKKRCVVCEKKRGNRGCKNRHFEELCSLCCAEQRDFTCEGCRYYAEAQKHNTAKAQKIGPKHFIAEVNPEVEHEVDRGLMLFENGKVKKGEDIIRKCYQEHPKNYSVLFGLGVVHIMKDDVDGAIIWFDKSIAVFPYYLPALYNKAIAYQKKMDIHNMIKAFQEVIRIGSPDDGLVSDAKKTLDSVRILCLQNYGVTLEKYMKYQEIFHNAVVCMENQEWEKALEGFRICRENIKNHPQSYGNMGICYAQLGQKKEALASLDKALEIDPAYEPAITNREAVEALKEGETLFFCNQKTVDYYKERHFTKR